MTRPHVALMLCALIALSDAYLYMYEPGAPIELETPYDAYGISTWCDDEDRYTGSEYISCSYGGNGTPDACVNDPADVSLTPVFDFKIRTNETESGKLRVAIVCRVADPTGVLLAVSLNGTYPDIYQPYTPLASSGAFYHSFPVGTKDILVAARCMEPGKLPSRMSYFRMLANASSACYPYRRNVHYHELNLPRCNPDLVGADACDGQTIVAHPPVPTPASDGTPSPEPGSSPVSDLCADLYDSYTDCVYDKGGSLTGAERADATCGCINSVLNNGDACGSSGVCLGSSVSYKICDIATSVGSFYLKTYDVDCAAKAEPVSGPRVTLHVGVILMGFIALRLAVG